MSNQTIEDIIYESLKESIPKILDSLIVQMQDDLIEDFFLIYQTNGKDFKKAKMECFKKNTKFVKKLKIKKKQQNQ